MKPVARLISAWNTTWNRMIPARRNAAPADAPRLLLPKYTPIAPKRIGVDDGPDHDVEPALRRTMEHVRVTARDRADPKQGR